MYGLNVSSFFHMSCSRPLIGVYMIIKELFNDNTRYCSTYQSLSPHTDESGWPLNVSPSCQVFLLVVSRKSRDDYSPRTILPHSCILPLKHTSSQSFDPESEGGPGCQRKYQDILYLCHTVFPSRPPRVL